VTSFCLLLEKSLQTKHVKQEKIDNSKNKIHELLKKVPQILSDDIESLTADSVTYECLNLLEFIYSKSEFATKIQDSLTYNETDVLERLILLSKNMNTELLPDVISKMILSLDTQRLTDRLLSMADRLEEHLVNDSNEFQHVNLWKHLLQCKWDKDQKNVLFEVLPKVIMVSVKTLCTKNINESNNKRVLLKILCLAVTISKASPVTTYMSTIFNIFTNLKSLLECESFQEDLEGLYQILSLMLFLHTSSFSTTVHCFIHAVNNLLGRLVNLSKSEEMKQENFEPCFRRIGRLYGELGSHKEFMTKFSPYAISGYIKICSTESIPVLYKGLLDEGIYVIFDTCTDVELSMMSTSFENADREHFRQLRTFYERHHKFHGKT